MADLKQGNFSADGSTTALPSVSSFTVLAGSDGGSNFGGGTLTIEVSHDDQTYTTAYSFTEEGVQTSVDYVGGVWLKLTLSGSTTPDLDYSIKYE